MKNLKNTSIILSLVLIVSTVSIYSQDLIVTNAGDSLNCKINRLKENNVFFTFRFRNEVRNTLIPLDQVEYYQYKYYQKSLITDEKIGKNESFTHFKAEIYGGWSYWIAKLNAYIPQNYSQYKNELRTGYHFGGDFAYFFSEPIGFGLKYSEFKTSNKLDNVYQTMQDGSVKYGTLSDDVSIRYIGVFVSSRLLNAGKKNAFLLNMGIGYAGYFDKKIMVDRYTISGNSIGASTDFIYELGISKDYAIAFKISYSSGHLVAYYLNDGVSDKKIKLDQDSYESMNHIDLSIGLRFNSKK
jgi:hypothetical protein